MLVAIRNEAPSWVIRISALIALLYLVSLNPGGVWAIDAAIPGDYHKIGLRLQKEKRFGDADRVFSKGILKFPKAVELYYFRGRLRHDYMGNYKVYFLRAKAYAKLGMLGQAVRDFKLAVKYGPEYKGKAKEIVNKIYNGRSDF